MRRLLDAWRATRATKESRWVVVLTPSHDGRCGVPYQVAFEETRDALAERGIALTRIVGSNCSLLPTIRSQLLSMGLEQFPRASHFLLIDSDMGWQAQDVLRLLDHGEELVAAAGQSRHDGHFCLRFLPGEDPKSIRPDARGLVAVREVGTAFLLVSRTAVERIRATHPALHCQVHEGAPFVAYFLQEIEDGELLGEDFAFCRRHRRAGGTVYVDTQIQLSHYGLVAPVTGSLASLWDPSATP